MAEGVGFGLRPTPVWMCRSSCDVGQSPFISHNPGIRSYGREMVAMALSLGTAMGMTSDDNEKMPSPCLVQGSGCQDGR